MQNLVRRLLAGLLAVAAVCDGLIFSTLMKQYLNEINRFKKSTTLGGSGAGFSYAFNENGRLCILNMDADAKKHYLARHCANIYYKYISSLGYFVRICRVRWFVALSACNYQVFAPYDTNSTRRLTSSYEISSYIYTNQVVIICDTMLS